MLALARAERGADAAVREWRLHDLRRTCATDMAELGIPPHIIEVVLNHINGHKAGVAGIYNRAEHSAERKAALELWAARGEALVSAITTAQGASRAHVVAHHATGIAIPRLEQLYEGLRRRTPNAAVAPAPLM